MEIEKFIEWIKKYYDAKNIRNNIWSFNSPFCDDKNHSCIINTNTGYWKDSSTQTYGTIEKFLEDYFSYSPKNIEIPIYEYTSINANILKIAIGTNYEPNGGDAGHGGRTIFRLEDLGSTNMRVNGEETSAIEIILGGTSEKETFLECLEFAVQVLKDPKYLTRHGIEKTN